MRNRNSQAMKKLLKYDCSNDILEEVRRGHRVHTGSSCKGKTLGMSLLNEIILVM